MSSKSAIPSPIRRENIIYGPIKDYDPLQGGLGRYIFQACDKFGDQIMQICGETGESETFSSFKSRSIKVALEMRRRGISRKDVIAICTRNTLDSYLVPAAALYLGASIAPLEGRLSLKDSTHLISIIDPKMVFVDESSVELIKNALENNNKTDVEVVVFGSTFNEFLVAANEDFEPEYLNDDEMSFILFTSGTTGLPKGVILTQKSVYLGSKITCDVSVYGPCAIQCVSLFWVSGVLTFIGLFCNGTKLVLTNGFNVETAFELIQKYQVCVMFLASLNAHQICKFKNLDKYDTSSLEIIAFAGGLVSKAQVMKLKEMLPQTYCRTAYGMSELPGFASIFLRHEEELAENAINSTGRPVFNTKFKIVDLETEIALGVNKMGEIRIKADSLMTGYYKNTTDIYDSDGYFKTGDVGYFDDNCCLYIYNRVKEMFKYQNWHVSPTSIESIIKNHPDVIDAVVFGIPSEEVGHLPAAAVTVNNANVTEGDISAFVAERVSDGQTLRGGVYILDEMPKTPSEKIKRDSVKELIFSKNKI